MWLLISRTVGNFVLSSCVLIALSNKVCAQTWISGTPSDDGSCMMLSPNGDVVFRSGRSSGFNMIVPDLNLPVGSAVWLSDQFGDKTPLIVGEQSVDPTMPAADFAIPQLAFDVIEDAARTNTSFLIISGDQIIAVPTTGFQTALRDHVKCAEQAGDK